MDQQILRDLFASATKAARALGVDGDLAGALDSHARAHWRRCRSAVAVDSRNGSKTGTCSSPEMQHRHVSHSTGCLPDAISMSPDAGAHGSRQALAGDPGPPATGWATAWRINLWARLGDGVMRTRDA